MSNVKVLIYSNLYFFILINTTIFAYCLFQNIILTIVFTINTL